MGAGLCDADGTVRAVDYFQAPLGNLSEVSFLELWNGPEARRARQAALGRTSTGMRRACPIG
ncbi:MAG: SPASM domain-containing protein [Minicystis sp.]